MDLFNKICMIGLSFALVVACIRILMGSQVEQSFLAIIVVLIGVLQIANE